MKTKSRKLIIAISLLIINPDTFGAEGISIRNSLLNDIPEAQYTRNINLLSELVESSIGRISPKTLLEIIGYCNKDILFNKTSFSKPQHYLENGKAYLKRQEAWGTITYDFNNDKFSAKISNAKVEALPHTPLAIYWLVNAPCNLKCIHCYGNVEEFPKEALTSMEQLQLADKIIESGAMRVTIAGGEPLLRKDTPQIIEKLADAGISVILGTNGSYLTQSIMPSIKRTTLVELSLDSHFEITNNMIRQSRTKNGNTYKETLAAVVLCKSNSINLKILTCLNQYNYQDLEGIADLIYKHGVKNWGISWTLHAGRAKGIYSLLIPNEIETVETEILKQILRIQKKYADLKVSYSNRSDSTDHNKFSFLIFPNGRAFAEDLKEGKKFSYESLLTKPMSASWNQENYNIKQHFNRWVNNRLSLQEEASHV